MIEIGLTVGVLMMMFGLAMMAVAVDMSLPGYALMGAACTLMGFSLAFFVQKTRQKDQDLEYERLLEKIDTHRRN